MSRRRWAKSSVLFVLMFVRTVSRLKSSVPAALNISPIRPKLTAPACLLVTALKTPEFPAIDWFSRSRSSLGMALITRLSPGPGNTLASGTSPNERASALLAKSSIGLTTAPATAPIASLNGPATSTPCGSTSVTGVMSPATPASTIGGCGLGWGSIGLSATLMSRHPFAHLLTPPLPI